jgi:hypothetical protein
VVDPCPTPTDVPRTSERLGRSERSQPRQPYLAGGTGATRRLFGTLFLGLLLILAVPSSANALTDTQLSRCRSLLAALDPFRDQHGMRVLCEVGAQRSIAMGRAGTMWHYLGPVKRALAAAGVCWGNIGEVLAWTSPYGSGSTFIGQWRTSTTHWSVLMGTRYDRGGGGWSNQGGRSWAVYYMLDLC